MKNKGCSNVEPRINLDCGPEIITHRYGNQKAIELTEYKTRPVSFIHDYPQSIFSYCKLDEVLKASIGIDYSTPGKDKTVKVVTDGKTITSIESIR